MKIGIIADTHDNLPAIDKAVRRLNQEKVQLVLHLGDYVAGFAVLRFKPLEAKLIGIFGNNDGDHQLLEKRFKEINAEIRGRFAEVMVEGVKIAMTHGDELELLKSLIDTESYDVVAHAHSHEAKVERKGKTLVINSGEVCGYLSGKSTLALLDTQSLDARIVEI
ncbi:MAG TPA: metallophosphoesterase [Candidatus Krumholzibacteriaceae bacterium]|jgi:putative phosphoesterase|nr:metallophosphoesterase [Candidatus Krumholzibacteriaceae bacterium]